MTARLVKIGFTNGTLSVRDGAGLTTAAAGLAQALVNHEGLRVEVFGTVTSHGVDSDMWGGLPVHVMPGSPGWSRICAPQLERALHGAAGDLIHVHGLWLPHNRVARRVAHALHCPLIVSAHGQLEPWAFRRSWLKKKLAWLLYQRAVLRDAGCLHALHHGEVADYRRLGLANPVCVIPNGVDAPPACDESPPWAGYFPPDSRVLLFFGRLSSQKGVLELVHAWARVAQRSPKLRERWRLALVGWPTDGVAEKIHRLLRDTGLQKSVWMPGAQHGRARTACLARATAFVLPSRSEGLPMSVLEAWSHGLPVAITDACNLPDAFAGGAAFRLDLSGENLAAGLAEFLRLPDAALRVMGECGRRLTVQEFSWATVAARFSAVYRWLLSQGPKPECVTS